LCKVHDYAEWRDAACIDLAFFRRAGKCTRTFTTHNPATLLFLLHGAAGKEGFPCWNSFSRVGVSSRECARTCSRLCWMVMWTDYRHEVIRRVRFRFMCRVLSILAFGCVRRRFYRLM